VPYFLDTYDYTDDLDGRLAARPLHREYLSGLGDRLVASGPTFENGALLVFEVDSAADVEAILEKDPFATGGFVADRRIIPWDIVLGRWAPPQS
jgi:uncharacterized protein YciI